MARLYPPVLNNNITPIAEGDSLKIPFEMSRAVGISEVNKLRLLVKSATTGRVLFTRDTTSYSNNMATFSLDFTELQAGGWYKAQIAYVQGDEVGYYSNLGYFKYLGEAPSLEIEDLDKNLLTFSITYHMTDVTERMDKCYFTLKDSNGTILEESGEIVHNGDKDIGRD